MKVKDSDILIVPGYGNSGPDHWQSRWQQKLSTARRVEGIDWDRPEREVWAARIAEAIDQSDREVVIVAHSLGVPASLLALPLAKRSIAGAFLVAAPDLADEGLKPEVLQTFGPYSRERLPFPSVLIASQNDPYCAFDVAEGLSADWRSLFISAGDADHVNTDAGFGPWPEGLLVFSQFLSKLEPRSLH